MCVSCRLQKSPRSGDAKHFASFPEWLDFSEKLTDFDETAALVSHLDLVITVDSAVAHLAGALGKPVLDADRKALRLALARGPQ